MDEVQQLGDLLKSYAASETQRKQQFLDQCEHWRSSIEALFSRIEQWLEPLTAEGLLSVSRESRTAFNGAYPLDTSPFHSEQLSITLALHVVELIPQVMGAAGAIQIAVAGLTSDRHGSLSLTNTPPSGDWQWRKERGAKEAEVHTLTADLLALQLQALIPRPRA